MRVWHSQGTTIIDIVSINVVVRKSNNFLVAKIPQKTLNTFNCIAHNTENLINSHFQMQKSIYVVNIMNVIMFVQDVQSQCKNDKSEM